MKFQAESANPYDYLENTEIIDFKDSKINLLASEIKSGSAGDVIKQISQVFLFVRDQVHHTYDIQGQIVTCKASEVLENKQGICFAKSHLFAALIRCMQIPAGFCYQKLYILRGKKPVRVLHGFNAVYIHELNKWIRLDARGNKRGIQSEFSTEKEKLAFRPRWFLGEKDEGKIWIIPKAEVIKCLQESRTAKELLYNLPENF